MNSEKMCVVCGSTYYVQAGYCNRHYLQIKRHGHIIKTKYEPNEIVIDADIAHIVIFKNEVRHLVHIPLNKVVLVSQYKWHMNHYGYIVSSRKNQKIWLHRLLLNAPNDMQVDHKDRNPLNNTDENLRLCTAQENAINRSTQSNNTSGSTGIVWHTKANKWCARIKYNGKEIHLGLFDNYEDALSQRICAEQQYFGTFAPRKDINEWWKRI
jgi:hypothetical protein